MNNVNSVALLPTNEVMTLAKQFAESGMFTDTKQAAQAFVKIQAGQEIGIPPFAAMTGIHIIQGKPTIGAGLIASRVKGSGKYDYKVKEMTEKNCSIDFMQGKELIGNSSFSIEDAKKAQTKNIDKFPKNMLFARAISNGVKWFCPDIFSGPVYTPEEMGSDDYPITEDVNHVVIVEGEEKSNDENIMASLMNCTTVDELKSTYKALTKEDQKFYSETVAHLKSKLENGTK